jgi:tellurite resistance protein TerC
MKFDQLVNLVAVLVQIIFLEGILSLDNAAILGAIVLTLPGDQAIPWPPILRRAGRMLNPVLGQQQTAALRVGLLVAYLARAAALAAASLIIQNEWLQLLGALYLIKISSRELVLLRQRHGPVEDRKGNLLHTAQGQGFWSTVLMVEIIDLSLSLDNVVVVISLSRQLWLVMLGVAAGILLMRFAAGVFSSLMEKIPGLIPSTYALVFTIGVELLLPHWSGIEIPNPVRFGVNIGILLLALLFNRASRLLRMMRLPLRICLFVVWIIDRLFFTVLYPFSWGLNVLHQHFLAGTSQIHAPPHPGD